MIKPMHVTSQCVTSQCATPAVRDIPVSDNGSTWFATKMADPHIISSLIYKL